MFVAEGKSKTHGSATGSRKTSPTRIIGIGFRIRPANQTGGGVGLGAEPCRRISLPPTSSRPDVFDSVSFAKTVTTFVNRETNALGRPFPNASAYRWRRDVNVDRLSNALYMFIFRSMIIPSKRLFDLFTHVITIDIVHDNIFNFFESSPTVLDYFYLFR